LHRDVDKFVAIAKAHADEPDAEDHIRHALHDYLAQSLDKHGVDVSARDRETWLAMDLNLDAAGLVAWHERKERKS